MIRILLSFILGSILLIFGVNMMTKGIECLNVIKIEKILSRYRHSIMLPFFISIILTGILQSSTAVMLITVGLVDAGILSMYPALGIVYGCNIGTTVTAQLISFNLSAFAEIFIIIGLFLMLINNLRLTSSIFLLIKRFSNLGNILLGLGILLFGVKTLHSGAAYIQSNQQISSFVTLCGNSLLLSFIGGVILTVLVHSSSATVGLSIALFSSGLISLPCAIAFMLGDNIGTCITAQIAAISSGSSAKKIAFFHTFYNLICAIPVLIFIKPFCELVEAYTKLLNQHSAFLIANSHTIFNILSAIVFIPLTILVFKKKQFFSGR